MSGERGESSVFLVFDYAELDLLEVIRCTKNRSKGTDNRDRGYGQSIARRVRAIAIRGAPQAASGAAELAERARHKVADVAGPPALHLFEYSTMCEYNASRTTCTNAFVHQCS